MIQLHFIDQQLCCPANLNLSSVSHTLGWLDKLGVFLSLALCNLANFDQL